MLREEIKKKLQEEKKALSSICRRGRFPQDLSFTLHRQLMISPGKCKRNGNNNEALRVESQVLFEGDQDGMTLSGTVPLLESPKGMEDSTENGFLCRIF